jgi:hypothetical protein
MSCAMRITPRMSQRRSRALPMRAVSDVRFTASFCVVTGVARHAARRGYHRRMRPKLVAITVNGCRLILVIWNKPSSAGPCRSRKLQVRGYSHSSGTLYQIVGRFLR